MEFRAVSCMPSMVSISIVRELGPIITACECAGRIESGIGAEVGSMRIAEQIDVMCVVIFYYYKGTISTGIFDFFMISEDTLPTKAL